MGRFLLLLVAGLCAGCAGRPAAPATETVVVTTVELDFPTRERGALRFMVRLPPATPPAASVSWELFLDGVRFAAGLDGASTQEGGVVTVQTPLVSRHLSWREGDATLDVGLRGEVDVGGAERLHFRDRRELAVHGRPMLNIPLD